MGVGIFRVGLFSRKYGMCVCVCVCVIASKFNAIYGSPKVPLLSLVVASFPGLQSPNAVEGLVKLLRRMTSGRHWVDVGGMAYMPCIYILALQFTGSATPPTST